MSIAQSVRRVFGLPELRAKIVFTLLMLVVCRIGGFIPVPGVNGELALNYFHSLTGGGQNFFQLIDIFSGGAFSHMTIVALGVMPNISASIIIQLLVAVVPSLQREVRDHPELGRRKVMRWTRYATVLLAILQAGLFAKWIVQINSATPGIVIPHVAQMQAFGSPWLFYLLVIGSMTAGTLLLMWIGEQITERGIGNGISLIIAVGIFASLPSAIGSIVHDLNLSSQEPGQLSFSMLLVLLALFVLVVMATILIIQGQRRIPLQYARRIVGRHEVQATGSPYLPLKVNYAGVIPVIFASALLMFPATIAGFMAETGWVRDVALWLSPGGSLYMVLYVLLIVFFSYFWTATQFNPLQIASEMKRSGAFIPGLRQGKATQDFLESTMNRVTLLGALFLAAIAVAPTLFGRFFGINPSISYFFGGTSLLILVGVILDTVKQVESHLLTRRYDGFMQRGRVRSKY
jgi:preprotein translocase subunit SecY